MATVATNQFFCLSCRLTDELDLHGRCATCGSDAVTYPLRYRLSLLEADECIRETKAPLKVNLEDGEDPPHSAIARPHPNEADGRQSL